MRLRPTFRAVCFRFQRSGPANLPCTSRAPNQSPHPVSCLCGAAFSLHFFPLLYFACRLFFLRFISAPPHLAQSVMMMSLFSIYYFQKSMSLESKWKLRFWPKTRRCLSWVGQHIFIKLFIQMEFTGPGTMGGCGAALVRSYTLQSHTLWSNAEVAAYRRIQLDPCAFWKMFTCIVL